MNQLVFYLIGFLLCASIVSFGQKSFCDGWEAGYEEGMQSKNRSVFITPICPISKGGETYENGFERGFEKATGKKTNVISPPKEGKTSFCDGWEAGYTNTMNESRRRAFIVPICPIPRINSDSYDAGYIKGSLAAEKKLGAKKQGSFIQIDPDGTFCEGWEKGYAIGLQLWAEEEDKRVPLKITPICPIPKVNRDRYSDGFERGKQKAFEDMN
ncbi:MAG: hypothetical protein AAF598_14890 [Bacteroidota bacterium]